MWHIFFHPFTWFTWSVYLNGLLQTACGWAMFLHPFCQSLSFHWGGIHLCWDPCFPIQLWVAVCCCVPPCRTSLSISADTVAVSSCSPCLPRNFLGALPSWRTTLPDTGFLANRVFLPVLWICRPTHCILGHGCFRWAIYWSSIKDSFYVVSCLSLALWAFSVLVLSLVIM